MVSNELSVGEELVEKKLPFMAAIYSDQNRPRSINTGRGRLWISGFRANEKPGGITVKVCSRLSNTNSNNADQFLSSKLSAHHRHLRASGHDSRFKDR
jgi:hypothetical protein